MLKRMIRRGSTLFSGDVGVRLLNLADGRGWELFSDPLDVVEFILNRTTRRASLSLGLFDGVACGLSRTIRRAREPLFDASASWSFRLSSKNLTDAGGLFRNGGLCSFAYDFPAFSFLAGDVSSITETSSPSNALASALNFMGSKKSSSELSPTETGLCSGAGAGIRPMFALGAIGEPRLIVGRNG